MRAVGGDAGGGGDDGDIGGGLLIVDGVQLHLSLSPPFPPSFPRFLTPPVIALIFVLSEVEVAKWNQELLLLHTFPSCATRFRTSSVRKFGVDTRTLKQETDRTLASTSVSES